MSHRLVRWFAPLLLVFATTLAFSGSITMAAVPMPSGPVDPAHPDALQDAFAAAAQEFNVPLDVLLSVSYNLSRWETHGGQPSFGGGYGPMHLTQVSSAAVFDGKGESDQPRASKLNTSDPSLHTLDTAAQLLGVSADTLKQDPAQNIRGGAALLAQYAIDTVGTKPTDAADWYGAVAKYSGAQSEAVALDFANTVYTTIRQGVDRKTAEGQQVQLNAQNVQPNARTTAKLQLELRHHYGNSDCPAWLGCEFIPAAYQLNGSDPGDYGNYDIANRPADGLDIRYIVIHNTEVDYNTTLQIFQNPLSYVSTHYVVRSADGHIAQMVQNKNVAWHAGNWYVNMHAIGIEHEGFAIEGATWYTEQMYRSSAALVLYLALKYHIPIDRAHIIGHDDVPGPTAPYQAGMHWDPGPFWDWAHYMELIGIPISIGPGFPYGDIVTINPNFATNTPHMTYCYSAEVTDCRDVPPQPSNFVYMYTEPDFNAPLVTNPYINADPTRANNWANKAVAGQQFFRIESKGDWDAVYFGGQKAWFYNPTHATNTIPVLPRALITPKAGMDSIPVYGRAYPEAEAFPDGITPQSIESIYDMPAGQTYVATDAIKGDYYYAPTYATTLEGSDHVVVEGQTQYYQIFFNHRIGFVKASDVDVVKVQ